MRLKYLASLPLLFAFAPAMAQDESSDEPVIVVTGRGLEQTPATPAYDVVELERGLRAHPLPSPHASRNHVTSPMRRYHLWPPPARTSLIFGFPANTTIFAPAGIFGSSK